MAENEGDIVAVFKADVESYNKSMNEAIASTEQLSKEQKEAGASTQTFEKTTKKASGSISTLSKGLGGMVGLLGITGRLFGVNTEKLETLVYSSQQLLKISKDLANAQKLATVATKADTVAKATNESATVSLTVAERVLNAVRSAGTLGIGLVIGAVVALGTAIVSYIGYLKDEEKQLKRKKEIDEEQIRITNKLTEAYNKRNESLSATALAKGVRTGGITEEQAEIIEARERALQRQIEINKEIKDQELKATLAVGTFGVARQEEQKRINENRRKLEKALEDDLEADKKAIREKFAKIEDEDRKKDFEKAQTERDASLQREFEAFIRYWDAIDKADRERARKLLKQQLDEQAEALEKKAQQARDFQKYQDDLETENANDFKKNADKEAKKEADRKEKERIEQIEAEKQMIDTIFKAQEEAFERKQKLREEEITKQDDNIKRQQELADKGLANTLAFEEKKSADLARAQQEDAEKQKKIKLLETFLNALASYSKTDPDTAIQKALLEIALAQGAMAIFAEEGGIIGEIGERSTLSRKHKGGGDVLLHAQTGEGILPRDAMTAIGRRNFELLKNAGRHPIRDDIFGIPKITEAGGASVSNGDVVKELRHLQTIVKNKKESHFDVNKFGDYISTTIENGIKTAVKGKIKRNRFGS